jgi:hypothetical protein
MKNSLAAVLVAAIMAAMSVLPADARTKKQKRPTCRRHMNYRRKPPSLDGRITCRFKTPQATDWGFPYGPYCHQPRQISLSSARLFRNRSVPVEATAITGRTRSPEIRWSRNPPNDGTANGSSGVNSAPDLGGQRCGNHEGRGDSTGDRQFAEHLSLLVPNSPSMASGADRPQSVQGVPASIK